MTDAITILGIAGSLRQSSFNAALLRAAAAAAPASCTVDIASIRGIPLYDGDAEDATGVPDVVKTLKERVAAADARVQQRDTWRVQERHRLVVTTPAGHPARIRQTSRSTHGGDARRHGD